MRSTSARGTRSSSAERLVELARQALDAWERGQQLHVRGEAAAHPRRRASLRRRPAGALARRRPTPEGSPAAPCTRSRRSASSTSSESALAFGRALVRAILRRDRSPGQQPPSLRVPPLAARDRATRSGEACQKDAKVNPTPEPYRAFAVARAASRHRRGADARRDEAPLLRALARPRPGDRSARDVPLRRPPRSSARRPRPSVWIGRPAKSSGGSRPTAPRPWLPLGASRASTRTGCFAVHDFGNGEITLRTWLAPRTGGPASGRGRTRPGAPAPAHRDRRGAPPRRHRPHERRAALAARLGRRGRSQGRSRAPHGVPRMKRAGKLLYFTSGDSALTALDVLTGAAVWRVRDRLRFRVPPTLDHDALFALAGGASSAAQLHCDRSRSPGRVRWSQTLRPLPERRGSPLHRRRARPRSRRGRRPPCPGSRGLALVAYDRESGALRWETNARVAPSGTSWIAVDDLFIGNTPTGEIVAIEASTGELRYRHLLGPGPRARRPAPPRAGPPLWRALRSAHDVRVLRPATARSSARSPPARRFPTFFA